MALFSCCDQTLLPHIHAEGELSVTGSFSFIHERMVLFFFFHWAHGCCVAHTLSLINNRLIFITPGLWSALQTDTAAYNGNTSPSSQIQLTLGWNAPSYLTAHSSMYERSSSGHRSQELLHIQEEQQPRFTAEAESVTRTPRLILAAWQAPPELIDHCWEGFWIHLSCRETSLQQQHRRWARRAEGMEREQRAHPARGWMKQQHPLAAPYPSVGKETWMSPRRMWSRLQGTSKQQRILNMEVWGFLVLGYRQLWSGSRT